MPRDLFMEMKGAPDPTMGEIPPPPPPGTAGDTFPWPEVAKLKPLDDLKGGPRDLFAESGITIEQQAPPPPRTWSDRLSEFGQGALQGIKSPVLGLLQRSMDITDAAGMPREEGTRTLVSDVVANDAARAKNFENQGKSAYGWGDMAGQALPYALAAPAASTVTGMAAVGGATGAIAGALKPQEGQYQGPEQALRQAGGEALKSGLIGAVATPIIGKTAQGVGKVAGKLGQGVANWLERRGFVDGGDFTDTAQEIIRRAGVDPDTITPDAANQIFKQFQSGKEAEKFLRGRLKDPTIDWSKTRELLQKSESKQVGLLPAELTGSSRLANDQKILSKLPDTQGTFNRFYTNRNEVQAPNAISRELEGISAVGSPDIAGEMGAKAAKGAMADTVKARSDAAAPIYDAAFKSGAKVKITPLIRELDTQIAGSKGAIKSSLQKARSFLLKDGKPDSSVSGLHESKLAVDNLIETAGQNSIGRTAKRRLVETQEKLIKAITDAEPKYGEAMAIFREGSEPVTELSNSVVKVLGDLNIKNYAQASDKLMASSSAEIARAGKAIHAKDPEAWKALNRSYLQKSFEKIADDAPTGPAFYKSIFKNDVQRQKLQAAMQPTNRAQWGSFRTLMDVLQASGRVQMKGSDTAFNQQAIKELGNDLGGNIASRALDAAEFYTAPTKIARWYADKRFGQNASALAELLTSPRATEIVKQVSGMPPDSPQAQYAVYKILQGAGIITAQEKQIPRIDITRPEGK